MSSPSMSGPPLSSPSMSSPSLSSPAMSNPASSSVNVQSCNVHPCEVVRHCPVLQCPTPFFYSSVNVQSCKFSQPDVTPVPTSRETVPAGRNTILRGEVMLLLYDDAGCIHKKMSSRRKFWMLPYLLNSNATAVETKRLHCDRGV